MDKNNKFKTARKILLIITLIMWFVGLWSTLSMGSELWVSDYIWDGADCSIFINFFVFIFCFLIFGAWFIIPTILMWIIYLIVWLIGRDK